MEPENIDRIIKLLPRLLETTVCNGFMIATLKSRKIFSLADEALLEALPNMMDRVKKMYEILMTRVHGYQNLVESLKLTHQSGALQLLGENFAVNEYSQNEKAGSSNYSKFNQNSERVKRFLEGDDEIYGDIKRQAFSIQEKVIFFNVRPPTRLFTGRSEELEKLTESIRRNKTTTVISQNSSITGLGGIGKTELAKMFIHSIDFKTDDPLFNCIIWINAEYELTANENFKSLARDKLGISTINANGGEEQISTILDKTYTRLQSRKSLIIFDNIENADVLEQYLPSGNVTGDPDVSILVTSQTSNWDVECEIRLSGMKEPEAIQFVKKGLGISLTPDTVKDEQITKLVARLEYFPLAISQAIAYIKMKKITTAIYGPEEYILDLDTKTKTLFTHSLSGTGTLYKKTIYQTVELTLSRIQEDENFGLMATRLAKLLAYMAADNVRETLFHELDEDLDGGFILLEKYSIINIVPREKDKPLCLNIHRLVQEVLRIILASTQEDAAVLQDCLGLLDGKLDSNSINHALSVWKYASKHSDFITKFGNFPGKITETLNRLMRPSDAFKFASLEHKKTQEIISYEQNADILVCLEIGIGDALHWQGKFAEAKKYLSDILDNAVKYLRVAHPTILKIYRLLVSTLARLYLFEDELKIYREWKMKADSDNNRENIGYLELLLEIGNIERQMKNNKEALRIFEHIVESIPVTGSPHHVLLVKAMRLVALTKAVMGDTVSALKELQGCLEYAELHVHDNQRLLLIIKLDLAVTLHRNGKINDSVEMARLVYKDCLDYFGPEHADTLNVKKNIVASLVESGPSENLLSDALEVYDDFRRLYGENFYLTSSAYATVGYAIYEMDFSHRALEILRKALTSTVYTSNAPLANIQLTHFYIALCLEKAGNKNQALENLTSLQNQITSQQSDAYGLGQKIKAAIQRLAN